MRRWFRRRPRLKVPKGIVYVSLHTSDPSQTGPTEVSGYARQNVTWASASGSGKAIIDGLPGFDPNEDEDL